jgi:hypothetical protein
MSGNFIGMTGQGATAVLTNGQIVGCVRSISLPELTQDKIDASCLDTTGFMRYIPGDLTDPGECQMEIVFDPSFDWSENSANAQDVDGVIGNIDTLTVTFPKSDPDDGALTPASLSGTGFISSYGLPEMSNNNLLVANVTFCFDGDTGPAFTPEA